MRGHRLLLEPEVHEARKDLPGNIRQLMKRALDSLAEDPRPPASQALDTVGIDIPAGVEIRRLRIGRWRVVYAVNDEEGWTWVLRVHQRPPYDY